MPFELRWDDPGDAGYAWRRYHTGPVTRLYQDAMRALFRSKRRCYELTGAPFAREYHVHFVDDWVYARGPGEDAASAERLRRHRERAATFADSYYGEEIRPEVVAIVDRLRRRPRPTAPYGELLAHLDECIDAHAHVMGDLHWRMAASREPFDWSATFGELTGEPPSRANVLLSGTSNESARLVKRLRALAVIAASDAELLRAVGSGDVQRLRGLPDRPVFVKFRRAFRGFLRRYGLRTGEGWGSTASTGAPTWNMRPDIPLGMVAAYARSDTRALDRREEETARARQRLLQSIRRALRDDPARLERFEAARQQAIATAIVMEDHNHWMDSCTSGVLREALDVVGRRLVRDGRIDDADGAMHLSREELGAVDGMDFRLVARTRRHAFEEHSRLEAPEWIGRQGTDPGLELGDKGEGLDGRVLRGVGASPGRYRGRAHLAARTLEPPDVRTGDILVATEAGPSWTPVFALIGGLVLDRGAAFQHAAIVAREFGIPAVLGTLEATSVIADGQTITVDGDSGLVEL